MCNHNNGKALICDPIYPKKLQSRFDKLLAVLEKQCQKTCRPMGFDYPFYHEPAKIPADHFQDCDENKKNDIKILSSKLMESKLLFLINGFLSHLKVLS